MEINDLQKETNLNTQFLDKVNSKEDENKFSQNQNTIRHEVEGKDTVKVDITNNETNINTKTQTHSIENSIQSTTPLSSNREDKINNLQIDSSSPFYFSDKPEQVFPNDSTIKNNEINFIMETNSFSMNVGKSNKNGTKFPINWNEQSNLDQYFDISDKKQQKQLRRIKKKMRNVKFRPNVILIDFPPNEEEIYRFHQMKHDKEINVDEAMKKKWLSSPRKIKTHDRTFEANEELQHSSKKDQEQKVNGKTNKTENDHEVEESIKNSESNLLPILIKSDKHSSEKEFMGSKETNERNIELIKNENNLAKLMNMSVEEKATNTNGDQENAKMSSYKDSNQKANEIIDKNVDLDNEKPVNDHSTVDKPINESDQKVSAKKNGNDNLNQSFGTYRNGIHTPNENETAQSNPNEEGNLNPTQNELFLKKIRYVMRYIFFFIFFA